MTALLLVWFSPVLLLVAPYVCRAYDAISEVFKARRVSRPMPRLASFLAPLGRRIDAWRIAFELAAVDAHHALDALHERYMWLVDPNYMIRLRFLMLMPGY